MDNIPPRRVLSLLLRAACLRPSTRFIRLFRIRSLGSPIKWRPDLPEAAITGEREATAAILSTLDEIKNEILFLKKWRNVDNVSIAGGEPLMHPDIMDVVAFIKQQGIKPIMLTNGVKLERQTVVELKKAGGKAKPEKKPAKKGGKR